MAGSKKSGPRSRRAEHAQDTKAMEMVAASKMRGAGAHAPRAPYGDKIRTIAAHLRTRTPVSPSVPAQARDRGQHRRDRGHLGQGPVRALNTNVLRLVVGKAKEVRIADSRSSSRPSAPGPWVSAAHARQRRLALVQVGDRPNMTSSSARSRSRSTPIARARSARSTSCTPASSTR
jgi:hypothetical protein